MTTDVARLDLPEYHPADTALHGRRFHEVVDGLGASGWLARMQPFGFVVLDREGAEHFLRCRDATFPGQIIAEVYGIEDGPLRAEIDRNILHLDGEEHRRLRALVAPSFTPRAVERWRPVMRGLLAALWEPLAAAGRCELVEEVARAYPAQVIASVMGAPVEDARRLAAWATWIQSQFDGPTLAAHRAEIEQAVVEFGAWCRELLAAKRDEPGDDLVSALLAADLGDVELVNLVLDVLVGGSDTTQAQLAHGLRLFAEHPEQWELLRADPALVPAAVEEVLRHEPITPFTARVLTAEVEHRGVRFPAGTVLLIAAVTANRDGAGDPGFDVTADRGGARVLTFGAGPHHCLGMALARAELEEAFAYLAPRMPGLRLAGVPVHGTTQGIDALESLPLAWDVR